MRSTTFADIDDELYTLAVALGSSFELEGLERIQARHAEGRPRSQRVRVPAREPLGDPLSRRHAGRRIGNLLKTRLPGGITPYRDRPEVPYTAVEPYSGQNRTCRFLVTHLQGKAQGATLVLFRWIGPNLRSLARLDRALAGFVVLGFLGTAAILAGVVTRALKTVEEVTATAEAVEATDLSRRVRVLAGGEEFRRLAAVINSLLERLDLAFRAQKRLIADAAHELKTPTAVLVGEAQEALRPDATPRSGGSRSRRSSASRAASPGKSTRFSTSRAATPRRRLAAPPWTSPRSRRRPSRRRSLSAARARSTARSAGTARRGCRATAAAWCAWPRTSCPTPSCTPRREPWSKSPPDPTAGRLFWKCATGARAWRRKSAAASSSASCASIRARAEKPGGLGARARDRRAGRRARIRAASRSKSGRAAGRFFRVVLPAIPPEAPGGKHSRGGRFLKQRRVRKSVGGRGRGGPTERRDAGGRERGRSPGSSSRCGGRPLSR